MADAPCWNCDASPTVALGLCGACYEWQRTHGGEQRPEELFLRQSRHGGELEALVLDIAERIAPPAVPPPPACSEDPCDEPAWSEGRCKRHADLAWHREQRG